MSKSTKDITDGVQVSYGKQTFRGSSASVTVYALTEKEGRWREFPGKVLKSISQGTSVPASTDNYEDHGVFYRQTYEAVEGKILLIENTGRINARPYYVGALAIRLRETGPYLDVQAVLPTAQLARYETLPCFNGRGDILDSEDMEEYGLNIPDGYLDRFFDEDEVEEAFRVRVLIPEKSEKPELMETTDSEGKRKMVAVSKRPRRKVRVKKR